MPFGIDENSWIYRQKVRLQWSGWLQYLPTGVASVPFLLTSWVVNLFGRPCAWLLYWPPLLMGGLLLCIFTLDLLVVKFGLSPREPIPAPLEGVGAVESIGMRRSCRSFQRQNLTTAHREEILKVARQCSEPARLLGDSPIRFEYVRAPMRVWPVVGCHEFLIAVAPREYNRMSIIDVGRALEKVVLHATKMGLATCWIGPGTDQKSAINNLGDRFNPDKDHIIVSCAIGYESWFSPLFLRLASFFGHRSRLPLSELFYSDATCTTPLDTAAPPFQKFQRAFEACRSSPSSFNAQPTRCSAVLQERNGDEDERLLRMDFLSSTNSRYYAVVALGIWLAHFEVCCSAFGVDGRYKVLTEAERGATSERDEQRLPRYDISWVFNSTKAD